MKNALIVKMFEWGPSTHYIGVYLEPDSGGPHSVAPLSCTLGGSPDYSQGWQELGTVWRGLAGNIGLNIFILLKSCHDDM